MNTMLNQPQFAKELKPLLWPWIGAIVAGSLMALRPAVDGIGSVTLLEGIVVYGFFGGLALAAAVSFGEEFQNRTLSLLLTQPVPRSRLWRQKILTLAAVVLAAMAVVTIVTALSVTGLSAWYPRMSEGLRPWEAIGQSFSAKDALLGAVFILATVCSCGFWTLTARSSIGGLVFTIAAECLPALGAALIFEHFSQKSEVFQGSAAFNFLVLGGLVYSAVFLWLGRCKFLGFEVDGGQAGAVVVAGGHRSRAVLAVFRIKQTTRFLNFVHKELRLLKPVTQLAGVFCICWLAILALEKVADHPTPYLFDVLVSIYAPLICLLTGCVSLGEEKALGLVESQLTLPFSAWRQWLLKLVVCGGVAILLSLGLPLLLFRATGLCLDLSHSALKMDPEDHGLVVVLACLSAMMFVIGFWAIAHVPNTVLAAIGTVIGVVVVGLCFALGLVLADHSRGVIMGLVLTSIMTSFHLSPTDLFSQGCRAGPLIYSCMIAGLAVVLLVQGWSRFRRSQQRLNTMLIDSIVLAALVVTASFLGADYRSGLRQLPQSVPVIELRSALNAIARPQQALQPRVVLPEELVGRVSDQTLNWLRGAKVSYQGYQAVRAADTAYQATILFPDGGTFSFDGGFVLDRWGRWSPIQ